MQRISWSSELESIHFHDGSCTGIVKSAPGGTWLYSVSTAPLAPPLAAEATKVSWRYRPSIVAWHCWFLAQLVQLACGSQLSLLGGGQHVCIPPFLNNEQSLGSKPNTTSLLRSQDGTQGRSPQRCGFCQIHSPPRSPRASTGFSSPSPGEGLRGLQPLQSRPRTWCRIAEVALGG